MNAKQSGYSKGCRINIVVPPEFDLVGSAAKRARLVLILHEAASSFQQGRRFSESAFTEPSLLHKGLMASFSHPFGWQAGSEGPGSQDTPSKADYVPAIFPGAPLSGASFPQASRELTDTQLPDVLHKNPRSQEGAAAGSIRGVSSDDLGSKDGSRKVVALLWLRSEPNHICQNIHRVPSTPEGYTYQLVKRLRAALELLMTTIRPQVGEVVSMKGLLFCFQKSPALFQRGPMERLEG
ncbi:hypothetical protein Esti_003253 [Eimeria stiedai]